MYFSFFNTLIKGYLKYRHTRVEAMCLTPHLVQREVLQNLIKNLKKTQYGQKYNAYHINDYDTFNRHLPIVCYEDVFDYIDKMMAGKENILWPGRCKWFAKSSGTTNDKSKYIPITDENLFENHVAAGWDVVSIIYQNHPEAKIFDKKNLIMGGALSLHQQYSDIHVGDVSAILLDRMPAVGRPFYTPDFDIALLQDWEVKINKMAHQCIHEDVYMFAGVPTWTKVLFEKMLDISGKSNILEIWPNAEVYFHGGVGFDPYRASYHKMLPSPDFTYYDVYNASEGYFAFQDRINNPGMLLLLDNAIFYEFIPLEKIDSKESSIVPLSEVVVGQDYAIVISTSSGLWRYMPGDVIQFVSVMPYRILVSGRTAQYINVFGEEVMVANTDAALLATCQKLNCQIKEYTVAPCFMDSKQRGRHDWLIEFEDIPTDITVFETLLDTELRALNGDYDAKRYKDIVLAQLSVTVAHKHTFHTWLKEKGKLGGQSKIPRLSNSRQQYDNLCRISFSLSNN